MKATKGDDASVYRTGKRLIKFENENYPPWMLVNGFSMYTMNGRNCSGYSL